MKAREFSTAKEVSIIAVSSALFAVFFFLSFTVALPIFTFLYLPIILLGVFPLWLGWSGLVGSCIGALIGGIYVEGLYFNAWIEVTTAIVIYVLNWILIPKMAVEMKTKKSLALLVGIYALTLFVGTVCILGQYVILGLFTAEFALLYLLPTFGLNLVVVSLTCPVLVRSLSPKMRSWGIYSGTLSEWWSNRKLSKL